MISRSRASGVCHSSVLALVLLLVALARQSVATDYFVNPSTGLDTNPGSAGLPFASLRKAIDTCATTGDQIFLADGTYTGADNIGLSLAYKTVNLVGASKAGTVIDCGTTPGPLLVVALGASSISNMTIANCASSGAAGAITVSGSSTSVAFSNMVFRKCRSSLVGGALQIALANASFTDVLFDSTSALNGGVLYVTSSLSVSLNNVTVYNATGQNGAAIMAYASTIVIRNTIVRQCVASIVGVMYMSLSTVSVYSSKFFGNSAVGDGTCFYNNQVQFVMDDCLIKGNYNSQSGAGFSILSSAMLNGVPDQVTNTIFSGNSNGDHGAVYVKSNGTVVLTNCKFFDNVAISGAGVSVSFNGTVTLDNCELRGNVATYAGTAPSVTGVTSDGGGALNAAKAGALLTVHNCVIVNNTAQLGGALLAINFAVVTITGANTLIANNTATFMGGGIYVEDVQTSVTMDNSYNITMEGNTALYGGAFASAVDGALLMNNVIMRNNHAHQGSAGYVVGTLILTRGYFSNNQATMMNGGVVYYYSANHAQNCSTCVVLPDNVDDTSGTPTPSAITSAPSQLSVSSSNLDFAAGGAGTPSNPLVSADLVSGTTIELDLTVRDALGNLIQSVSTNYKVVATLSPILNGALVGYSAVTLNAGAASVSITFVGYLNSPFTLAIQVVDLSGALLASVAPLTIAFSTSSNCGEDKTQQLTTVSNGLTYPICVPAELSTVSTSAFIAVQVVTSLCAVGTIVIFVILRRHLSHSSIRASSPVLLQFMLASTVLVYAAIFLMGVDSGSDDNSLVSLSTVASNICRAIPWLLGLGFDLVYGAMLAKAWRIHKIFNNRLRRRIMLTDGNLIKHIVIFAMHDIILNAVWVGVDPLGLEYHVLSSSSSGTTVTSQCRSDNFGIYLAIYLAFKGAVLLAGIYLAIACRNVADQFNESKQLGFAIYNLTFISCIIIPLVLAIQASATVVYLIAAFGTLLALVMTIAIIFVPKIVLVYSGADTSVQNTSSKSNATIPRVNVSDASETQWAEINAHLSKLNAATLKRSAADFNDAFDSLAIILEHLSTAYEGSESRSHKSQGGPTSEHEMKSKVSNKASAEAVVVAV